MVEQRKLLLADDSITIQKVINLTFADEGIEVTAVGNGDMAIERLPEIAPDLVLADVHMPGLNGYEVCERIRNTPEFQNVPVMLLVGSFEPFDEMEARRVGANDYLTKPFQSIKQLVNKVHGLLDQSMQEVTTANAEPSNETEPTEETSGADKALSAVDNADGLNLDAAVTGGRSFAFGEAEFDDELIETAPGSKVEETQNDVAFDRTQDYSATNYQNDNNSPIEVEPEAEWQIVESDLQAESAQTEESFLNTAPTVELHPEMIPTEANENNLSVIEDDMQAQSESARFETANEQKELTEELSAAASEEISESQPQMGDSFEPDESLQNAQATQNTEPQSEAIENQEAVAQAQPHDDSPETAASAVQAVKPFIAPILDDDEFLLDIQFDESAAPQQTTDSSVEPITPEVVEPANEHPSQELTPVNQQTGLEKPTETVALSASQFPPEVIDAIAQRVVEKLSDKVIEKIAWEIVPDRFDLIVRKTIQNKDREG